MTFPILRVTIVMLVASVTPSMGQAPQQADITGWNGAVWGQTREAASAATGLTLGLDLGPIRDPAWRLLRDWNGAAGAVVR